MARKVSANVRNIIWRMMTDPAFRRALQREGMDALAKEEGIKLSAADTETLKAIDTSDLGAMLSSLERDMSLVMGGSRPRNAIALSDAAIAELETALKKAKTP
jgi:hypothetical protein